ncbi:kinase-like domain-containing protein [Zychaea mexicana]|uniref:kinase-like domain-containing protein n=1 Tax=Zychaea mexicana TaxID=64656 RepID=UPI0022FDD705|nr:kinase-like domain-containing protein [Zychaea mexicana]KAI9490809.1 kinase-like domain-containing protein [Zychaea mexicana]
MVDQVIGDYQLLEELGHGSYGSLFLGQSLKDGGYVAVKILSKSGLDHEQLKLQQLEADIQSELKHANILALHSVIQTQDHIFMVMELCDQGDLFDFVVRDDPLRDEQLVKTMFIQILDAVEHMHANGVYHRDIKLENILLKSEQDDESDLVCKVADFGLATRERLSMEFGCGSSTYLAPEHFDDSADHEVVSNMNKNDMVPYDAAMSDVWSLGVLLLALLFGRNPWQEATSLDPAFAEFKRNPVMLKNQLFEQMSVPCFNFLKSCLSLDAADRPSVADMKAQFLAIPSLVEDSPQPLEQNPMDIPVSTKPTERASFDSAIFSATAPAGASWSDMVEEDEMLETCYDYNNTGLPSPPCSLEAVDEDDDTDMFVHSDEKESWWL